MSSGLTRHISPKEFDDWFSRARPGDTVSYALGDIGRDRKRSTGELRQLADMVLRYAQSGVIYLTQRRGGSARYEYRATKADPVTVSEDKPKLRKLGEGAPAR